MTKYSLHTRKMRIKGEIIDDWDKRKTNPPELYQRRVRLSDGTEMIVSFRTDFGFAPEKGTRFSGIIDFETDENGKMLPNTQAIIWPKKYHGPKHPPGQRNWLGFIRPHGHPNFRGFSPKLSQFLK